MQDWEWNIRQAASGKWDKRELLAVGPGKRDSREAPEPQDRLDIPRALADRQDSQAERLPVVAQEHMNKVFVPPADMQADKPADTLAAVEAVAGCCS